MNSIKPRVRFAPSPSGQLHLGGARTALFNWLFAKGNDGKFLLRIEDTDKVRSKQEYTNQICDSLKWLGLEWDEEIVFQSQRLEMYKSVINKLLESGKAYRCFCSKEQIAADRQAAEAKGGAYLYPGTCKNLTEKEVKQNLDNGAEFAVRIKIAEGTTSFEDKIYGTIKIDNKELDDFIIARTDGTPVYNLVVVVDDNDMEITHVIRGEDHVSNTHKQIIICNALNYSIPVFAHLPMILGADKRRLSKRHGATGVQEYREQGYLPEALTNYLALLGWNPGTEQEIFTTAELISAFDIDRIQKKSAVFDEQKLVWVNYQHLKNKTIHNIYDFINEFKPDWTKNKDKEYVNDVIELNFDRIKTLKDITHKTNYFFDDPTEYEEKAVRKRWKDKSVNELMEKFIQKLNVINNWNHQNIENSLRFLSERENISAGKIIHPTRLALSGIASGPSLFEMMELLGKEICINRLNKAIIRLPLNVK